MLLLPLLLLAHLLLLINTRFTLWPEMVIYPYLFNNHFSLYSDIITNYPPLFIYFLTFWTRVFGYQPINLQILTYLIITVIDLLIFVVANRLFGKVAAYFSLSFFVILSLSFGINGLWFDLVVTPFILVSLLFFPTSVIKFSSKALFFSILPLTVAFFIKQQVIWLIFWYLVIFSFKFRKQLRFLFHQILIALAPLAILTALCLFFFYQKNLLYEYIFWIFRFPLLLVPPGAGYHITPTFRQLLPVVALFGFFVPAFSKKKSKINLILLVSFILIAFAYRFDYFHLIPSLAVLSLTFPDNLKSLKKSKLAIRSIFALSLIFLIVFTIRYLKNNWTQDVRFFEKDIAGAALTLSKITNPDDAVYIQNGPDQILALSNRLPSKPWADEFPWYLEIPDLQEKVVNGIEKQDPKFIIFKPYEVGSKYELGVYRPEKIADYLDASYQNQVQISNTLWLKVRK